MNAEPTAQDLRNAAAREAIAAAQQAEYARVLLWAMGKFGVRGVPPGRLFLCDKADEDAARRTGAKLTLAATCYSVRHMHTGREWHFTVDDQGVVTEHE